MTIIIKDKEGYAIGDLKTIVSHYNALRILIDSADLETLRRWDNARIREKDVYLEIKV